METVLFALILALLFVYERDAIRAKEWKMFVVLKNMDDELAFRTFTLIHIPLYFFIAFAFVLFETPEKILLKYLMDVFLIAHAVIHYSFRKKPNNDFHSSFSKIIIYALSIFAVMHICLLSFN